MTKEVVRIELARFDAQGYGDVYELLYESASAKASIHVMGFYGWAGSVDNSWPLHEARGHVAEEILAKAETALARLRAEQPPASQENAGDTDKPHG